MKYLLLPVTALVWCLATYYAIYYGVVLLGFVFSFSWLLLIFLSFVVFSLSGVITAPLWMCGLAIARLYREPAWLAVIVGVVHSIAGLCGVFMITSFFYDNLITWEILWIVDDEPIFIEHVLLAMWKISPMKTIYLAPTFIGLLLGVIVGTVIGPSWSAIYLRER